MVIGYFFTYGLRFSNYTRFMSCNQARFPCSGAVYGATRRPSRACGPHASSFQSPPGSRASHHGQSVYSASEAQVSPPSAGEWKSLTKHAT